MLTTNLYGLAYTVLHNHLCKTRQLKLQVCYKGINQISSLNNIGKKARDSNMYCTPRHIMTSLQKWALFTKQWFASPLEFDPSYQTYWSKNIRDTVFGASTNAFDTKFTGFSFCHPNYCNYLLHLLVGHALQSANSTQEATATLLLLPDWLGWSKNGYMTWINDYPEHVG